MSRSVPASTGTPIALVLAGDIAGDTQRVALGSMYQPPGLYRWQMIYFVNPAGSVTLDGAGIEPTGITVEPVAGGFDPDLGFTADALLYTATGVVRVTEGGTVTWSAWADTPSAPSTVVAWLGALVVERVIEAP